MTASPSDSVGRSEQERREYLAGVLRLNPATDAEQIVALRRDFRGLREPPASRLKGPPDLRQRRERAEQVIGRVRARFWQAEMDQVRRLLRRLSLEHFPDLQRAVQRLLVVADHQSELQQVAQLGRFAPEHLAGLKEIFTGTAREASEIKDQFFITVSRGGLGRAKRLLRALRRHSPALYELEQDWLDMLRTLPSWHFFVARHGESIAAVSVLVFIIVVIVAFIFLAQVDYHGR